MKRFHVHLGVDDLQASIGFYSTLFAAPPTVQRPDYAKWMLEDPRVNFAISSGHATRGVEHLGIQVEDEGELAEVAARLAAADAPVLAATGRASGATVVDAGNSSSTSAITPHTADITSSAR